MTSDRFRSAQCAASVATGLAAIRRWQTLDQKMCDMHWVVSPAITQNGGERRFGTLFFMSGYLMLGVRCRRPFAFLLPSHGVCNGLPS